MKSKKIFTTNDKTVNICFVSHFHQPYWQPLRKWNQIKNNSYLPWLKFLKEMVNYDDFFINIHFSGPFLTQMAQHDESFLQSMKNLLKTRKINPISGFMDEAFIQLSSRPDDVYFQLKEYLDFSYKVLALKYDDFCGIHVVEREVNERLIYKIGHASQKLNLKPLMYLDVETFYETPNIFPGDNKDLYYKYFNTKNAINKTSIPFFPRDGFSFIFRDEVGGYPLYFIPFHSEFRYFLLKRKKINRFERIISPNEYMTLLLKKRKNILEFTQKYKTKKEPIILIFTDAERLGQWSGEPNKDLIWLKKLLNLIRMSDDFKLITMQTYFQEQGFLDTYPCKSSNSYPEFKNWSGNRGIRGIVFADPKLRKVYSQTIQLEKFQQEIENLIIKKTTGSIPFPIKVKGLILESHERFEIIKSLIKKLENPILYKLYCYMNRIRNISYLEDGKWATRHPYFGNQPHLDLMSLTFLDISEFIGLRILKLLKHKYNSCKKQLLDWDHDGYDELILENSFQKVILSLKGGHIVFHQIRSKNFVEVDDEKMLEILESLVDDSFINRTCEQLSTNICLTEPDSLLNTYFHNKNTRIEECRDSCRVEFLIEEKNGLKKLGNFSNDIFKIIEHTNKEEISTILEAQKEFSYGKTRILLNLKKKFRINNTQLEIEFESQIINRDGLNNNIIISPEFIFTLLPTDGINFQPNLFINFFKLHSSQAKILYEIEFSSYELNDSTLRLREFYVKKFKDVKFKSIFIIPKMVSENDKVRYPQISITLDENSINNLIKIEILPAIKDFYKNVFPNENSKLSYHTSGIKIRPYIKLSNSSSIQKFSFIIDYELDNVFNTVDKNNDLINLIKIN